MIEVWVCVGVCGCGCVCVWAVQMLAVFAMCGMYITNVHPAYHEKLALQLQVMWGV